MARKGYTQRLAATLIAIFGAMALFLAAIGLYAVMSYFVSQSTRELGLRMALGANARDLLRFVVSRGLQLIAAGIVIGGIVALILTRLMGDLLYKVSPHDPLAFGSALAVITIASLAACFSPPGARHESIQSRPCTNNDELTATIPCSKTFDLLCASC